MPLLPLLAVLATQPADSAAPELRVMLGAEHAYAGHAVPGIVMLSAPASGARAATLRLASAAPVHLWWRAGAGDTCRDDTRGSPVLVLRRDLLAGEAFYFCARPRGDAPLRLAATLRAGNRTATAAAELPSEERGALPPAALAIITALLGLGSGILVNYFTSSNQLRADLAKDQQNREAEERGKRIKVVDAVHQSLVAEIQQALRDLRTYADSAPPAAESYPQLRLGGMQVVMNTELVKSFLESSEWRGDFERLKRIFLIMAAHNRAMRQQPDMVLRRAHARRTIEEIEAELVSMR